MGNLLVGRDMKDYFKVFLRESDHRKAIYLLGLSGTGKSTLMANMALAFHSMGDGVMVVDTKDGVLTSELAGVTPRPEDTVYVAPGLCRWDGEWHYWGLNLLEYDKEASRRRVKVADRIATSVLDIYERMDQFESGLMTQVGEHLEMSVRLAIARPGATFLDVRKVLTEPEYRRFLMDTYTVPPEVREHWERFERMTPNEKQRAVTSTVPRIHKLTVSPVLNFMVTQEETTLRLSEWLDAGKLVLIDLGSGDIEPRIGRTIGNLIMALAVNAAFARQDAEKEDKRHWRFLVDEFHRIAPEQFAELIDLIRSRRVWPVLAHQNKEQLKDGRSHKSQLLKSVSGVPVNFTFDVSDEDRHYIKQYQGEEAAETVRGMPQHTARLSVRGSLPDSGFPCQVALLPLAGEYREEQRQRLIDAQRPFTRPERELAAFNRRRYYDRQGETQGDTSRGNDRRNDRHNRKAQKDQTEPIPARPERPPETDRDDRAGSGDSVPPRPAPIRHRRSDPDDF